MGIPRDIYVLGTADRSRGLCTDASGRGVSAAGGCTCCPTRRRTRRRHRPATRRCHRSTAPTGGVSTASPSAAGCGWTRRASRQGPDHWFDMGSSNLHKSFPPACFYHWAGCARGRCTELGWDLCMENWAFAAPPRHPTVRRWRDEFARALAMGLDVLRRPGLALRRPVRPAVPYHAQAPCSPKSCGATEPRGSACGRPTRTAGRWVTLAGRAPPAPCTRRSLSSSLPANARGACSSCCTAGRATAARPLCGSSSRAAAPLRRAAELFATNYCTQRIGNSSTSVQRTELRHGIHLTLTATMVATGPRPAQACGRRTGPALRKTVRKTKRASRVGGRERFDACSTPAPRILNLLRCSTSARRARRPAAEKEHPDGARV